VVRVLCKKPPLSIGVSPQEFEPPWLLFNEWSYDRVVKVIDSKAFTRGVSP
jgi:hypothetical protein